MDTRAPGMGHQQEGGCTREPSQAPKGIIVSTLERLLALLVITSLLLALPYAFWIAYYLVCTLLAPVVFTIWTLVVTDTATPPTTAVISKSAATPGLAAHFFAPPAASAPPHPTVVITPTTETVTAWETAFHTSTSTITELDIQTSVVVETQVQPEAWPQSSQVSAMSWVQKQFTLPAHARGSYLITDTVVLSLPEVRDYRVGLLNLFIQHTSCALSLNENWDEDVRDDMSDALDRIAPEAGPSGENLYRHNAEGSDDMPAHIKSALIGASVTLPIRDGKLALGTWQGIWYLEFRASKHQRKVVATIQGEKKPE